MASTGQGFLGCNMFAYCNNNPVNRADKFGDIPASLFNYDPETEKSMKELVENNTIIEEVYIKTEQGGYWTFIAHINADCFLPYYSSSAELVTSISCYSHLLFEEIARRAEETDKPQYYVMSESHIQSELSAHLLLWFSPVGKGLGFGKVYNSTKVVDLNVDEDRKEVLFLMEAFGYTGEEVIIGGKN